MVFFASLSLVTDQDSFKKGIGLLTSIPKLLGGLGTTAIGVASAFVSMGAASATALTKLADNARVLGLSARNLDNWRNAARIAGGDADAFQGSLETLNKSFYDLKTGKVNEGMIQALGMTGADFSKLQSMPMQQKIATVWEKLEAVKDPDKQKSLAEQLFGKNGQTMLAQMQMQGLKLSDVYGEANKRNLYTDQNYSTALKGKTTLDETVVSMEELFNKIGIEIETALLPSLQNFSKWLRDNKTELQGFAEGVGNVARGFSVLISGITGLIGFLFQSSDQQRVSMLGGKGNAEAFDKLGAMRGFKKGSLEESLLFMSTDWNKIATALKAQSGLKMVGSETGNAILTGLFQKDTDQGIKADTISKMMNYAKILDKAGIPESSILSQEQTLNDKVLANPQINLTVNVDKNGNVSVVNSKDNSVIVSQAIANSQAYGIRQ